MLCLDSDVELLSSYVPASPSLQMIDTDLNRTFTSLMLFGPGQPLHSQVLDACRVLFYAAAAAAAAAVVVVVVGVVLLHGSRCGCSPGPVACDCCQIRDALDAFVCFRPDVGYIQGLSFLAAMICLYCDSPYVLTIR
jgi:hypothetical protein